MDDISLRRIAERRIGKTLEGKYTVDRVLGMGGMAVVYAATHRNPVPPRNSRKDDKVALAEGHGVSRPDLQADAGRRFAPRVSRVRMGVVLIGIICAPAGGCSQAPPPPPSVILASGAAEPQFLTADTSNLYWTELGSGQVTQLPKNGGAPIPLAIGQQSPEGIAVDGTSVYWANEGIGLGSIMKAPIGGGSLQMLVAAQACATLCTGQTSSTAVYSGLNAGDVATDGTWVYWANTSGDGTPPGVLKVPVQGGTPVVLYQGGMSPARVAVDATAVYWTDPPAGTVMKTSLDGSGSPVTLASGETWPVGLAVDGTSVYWADMGQCSAGPISCVQGDSTSAVKKVPLAGGAPVVLATGVNPLNLAVGAQAVSWTTGYFGKVWTARLDGSSLRLLYSGMGFTAGVAVDDTSVYWTNYVTDEVRRVPAR